MVDMIVYNETFCQFFVITTNLVVTCNLEIKPEDIIEITVNGNAVGEVMETLTSVNLVEAEGGVMVIMVNKVHSTETKKTTTMPFLPVLQSEPALVVFPRSLWEFVQFAIYVVVVIVSIFGCYVLNKHL
jgi:hypothetical protein